MRSSSWRLPQTQVVPTGFAHSCEELLARHAVALGALMASRVPIAGDDEPAALDERSEAGEDRVVELWSLDGASELLRVAAPEDIALGSAWGCVDAGCDRLRTVA